MGKWEDVERLYRSMKLYNGVLMNWMEQILSPILFCACAGVTILLYVTVRPSGLPFFVYIWFPVVAFGMMGLVSVLIYDGIIIKRAAEEVAGKLESRSGYFYRGLSVCQRKELRRRARALRPLRLSFGNFAEFSFEMLANIWDEVLNQLLFLLSL